VTPYFEGVTETLVILSKKNGKSTLVAALIIYHVLTTPDADCVVFAVSREQAEIILRQASGFIRRNPGLQKRLKVLRREIMSLEDVGRARVLAADEDTAEGVIPTLVIMDEFHGAKSASLYDSLRMGLDARQGRMVTITIAGTSMGSSLGQKRAAAYQMPGFNRDKKRRRSSVRSANGTFQFLEWCLNPDDDPDDLDIVKLVNPAPWKTKEKLAILKEAITPWSWLRLACGIWTEGEEPWIEPAKWDELAYRDLELEDGVPTWFGIDMGTRGETAAIALVQSGEEGLVTKVEILDRSSLAEVEARLRELRDKISVVQAVYITQLFRRSAEMLEAEGLPIVEYPQSPDRMGQISATLYKLIEEKKLHHDGAPPLRVQVLAGRVKETERGWRFHKDPQSPVPIDALLALAAAAHSSGEAPLAEPAFVLL
jgi:phage terminase large subunit-like protein